MNAYIMIIIADILLAANFVFQKKYQSTAGTTLKAGLMYNALTGAFSALMFLIINRFEIRISGYSLVMAAIFACVLMLYIFIGFRIMENGSMSLYTLFLMSGGIKTESLKLTTSRVRILMVRNAFVQQKFLNVMLYNITSFKNKS